MGMEKLMINFILIVGLIDRIVEKGMVKFLVLGSGKIFLIL